MKAGLDRRREGTRFRGVFVSLEANAAAAAERMKPDEIVARNALPTYSMYRNDVIVSLVQERPCPRCTKVGVIVQDIGTETDGVSTCIVFYCRLCRNESRLGRSSIDAVNRNDMRGVLIPNVLRALAMLMRANPLVRMNVASSLLGAGGGISDSPAYECVKDTGLASKIVESSRVDSCYALEAIPCNHVERCAGVAT